MKNKTAAGFAFVVLPICAALASLVIWPELDLVVSGWFYVPGQAFFLRDFFLFDTLHIIAHGGARLLGLACAIFAVLAASQKKPVLGLGGKAWLFLFLGLVLGPGLVANTVLKDNWGRARPREVVEFGGMRHFSPPLIPADECVHNCSFVNGDGAFGFYLPAFGYVVPRQKSRRWFWGGMGLGALFGLARIAMGAHFFSDTLFAAFFVQLTLTLLHMAMFGRRKTEECWRNWLDLPEETVT